MWKTCCWLRLRLSILISAVAHSCLNCGRIEDTIVWARIDENCVLRVRVLLRFHGRADEKAAARSSTKNSKSLARATVLQKPPLCSSFPQLFSLFFPFFLLQQRYVEGVRVFYASRFSRFSLPYHTPICLNTCPLPPLYVRHRTSSAPSFSRSRYAYFSPKSSSWPFAPFPKTRVFLPPIIDRF